MTFGVIRARRATGKTLLGLTGDELTRKPVVVDFKDDNACLTGVCITECGSADADDRIGAVVIVEEVWGASAATGVVIAEGGTTDIMSSVDAAVTNNGKGTDTVGRVSGVLASDTARISCVTMRTGVGGMIGRVTCRDVSKLGAIISAVTTVGSYGHTPVLRNADKMISGRSA